MDLLNVIYAASIVFIFFSIYKIPISYYIIVLFHLLVIFVLNGVLFSPHYMPDQFRYIHASSAIRDSLDFLHYYQYDRGGIGNVANASLLFSLFPIPILHSIYSIAIINFILYAILFIFLYKKEILVGNALWFYLFFPSFMLYAGVGLRDILILFFMIMSTYLVYKQKIIIAILVASPLLFIKEQNFFIFVVSIVVYYQVVKGSLLSFKLIVKLLAIVVLFYGFIGFVGIGIIDHYRSAMYQEDGGNMLLYKHLVTYSDLIFEGTIGALYMILKPLPWESSSALQLFQSIENLFIFYFIYKIIKKQLIVKSDFINFLLVYFFIAMMIYGLVVFNYGTASRYRFPYELIFIVFSWSIFYNNEKELS